MNKLPTIATATLEDSEHVNMWLGKLFFLSMLVLLLFLKKYCFFDHIVDRTLKAVQRTLPTNIYRTRDIPEGASEC